MFDWTTSITTHPDFYSFILWLSIFFVSIGFIQNVIYAWCLPTAWLEINKRSQRNDDHAGWALLRSQSTLPITIIVPAHNEVNTIRESVMALIALQYPDLRIIVVNDGSSDATVAVSYTHLTLPTIYSV